MKTLLLLPAFLAVCVVFPPSSRADTPPYKRACQAGFKNVQVLSKRLAAARYDETSTPRLISDKAGALVSCAGTVGAKHLTLTVLLSCGDYGVPGCAQPMKAFLNGERVPLRR